MSWIGTEPIGRRVRIISEGVVDTNPTSVITVPGGYTVGNIEVYVDGLRLHSDMFDDSQGFEITFPQELAPGTRYMIVDIQLYEAVTAMTSPSPGTLVRRNAVGDIQFNNAGTTLNSTGISTAIRELLQRIEALE